jgi:hypothetical protein
MSSGVLATKQVEEGKGKGARVDEAEVKEEVKEVKKEGATEEVKEEVKEEAKEETKEPKWRKKKRLSLRTKKLVLAPTEALDAPLSINALLAPKVASIAEEEEGEEGEEGEEAAAAHQTTAAEAPVVASAANATDATATKVKATSAEEKAEAASRKLSSAQDDIGILQLPSPKGVPRTFPSEGNSLSRDNKSRRRRTVSDHQPQDKWSHGSNGHSNGHSDGHSNGQSNGYQPPPLTKLGSMGNFLDFSRRISLQSMPIGVGGPINMPIDLGSTSRGSFERQGRTQKKGSFTR